MPNTPAPDAVIHASFGSTAGWVGVTGAAGGLETGREGDEAVTDALAGNLAGVLAGAGLGAGRAGVGALTVTAVGFDVLTAGAGR